MNTYRTILLLILILINTVSIFYVAFQSLERDNGILEAVASSTERTRNIENEMLRIMYAHQISIGAMSEDYPPKKELGERSWCLNRSCVKDFND